MKINDIPEAARRTVCHFAADAPEAAELMCMLGIYPGQDDDMITVGPNTLSPSSSEGRFR